MFKILQDALAASGWLGGYQRASHNDRSGQAECGAATLNPAHNVGQQYFLVRSQLDYPPLSREVCCPR